MKLVFALVVLINNLPNNSDGMYFQNAADCNKVAFQTESGFAGQGENGQSAAWKSNGINIRAYCEPRLVDKSQQVF